MKILENISPTQNWSTYAHACCAYTTPNRTTKQWFCVLRRQTGIPWDSWWWLWVRSWRTVTFPTLASHTNCPGTPTQTVAGLRQRTQTAENRSMYVTWSMHTFTHYLQRWHWKMRLEGHLLEIKYADSLDFLRFVPKHLEQVSEICSEHLFRAPFSPTETSQNILTWLLKGLLIITMTSGGKCS